MGNMKIYEMVTNRILSILEAGTVPWRRPWNAGNMVSVNWKTGRPYRGINQFLLPFGGEYATFNQIREAGGRVKKGEKGHIVVLWKPVEKQIQNDDEEETIEKYYLLRYYTVFEINQCEGIKSKRPKAENYDHNPIEAGEKIVNGFIDGPEIRFASGRAFYKPLLDYVSVPPLADYQNPHEYYCTLFHELIHSTGHPTRLNREGITSRKGFGSDPYAFEELVAELGAAMLCAVAGIDNSIIENSTAYINSWLNVLRNDKKLIIKAASHAQKAADFILSNETKVTNDHVA